MSLKVETAKPILCPNRLKSRLMGRPRSKFFSMLWVFLPVFFPVSSVYFHEVICKLVFIRFTVFFPVLFFIFVYFPFLVSFIPFSFSLFLLSFSFFPFSIYVLFSILLIFISRYSKMLERFLKLNDFLNDV